MNAFDEALDRFERDGSFIYQDACLSTDHITRLKDSFKELDPNNVYQFHLSNVELVPQSRHNLLTAAAQKRTSSPGFAERAKRIGSSNFLLKKQAHLYYSAQKELEKELLRLFTSRLAWSSVKIDYAYFQQGDENKYLDESFHFGLLTHLTAHKTLTEFSLQPFSLSKGSQLLSQLQQFLDEHTCLEYLSLGVTEASGSGWKKLVSILSDHRGLKEVNFKNTVLNKTNYLGFASLASKNYRMNIVLPPLSPHEESLDIELSGGYQALTERLLTNTAEDRFIQERLSESSILNLGLETLDDIRSVKVGTSESSLHSTEVKMQLAEEACIAAVQAASYLLNERQESRKELEKNKNKHAWKQQEKILLERFTYLVGARGSLPASFLQKEYEVFPKVYHDNREYLENNLSLLQLDLNNRLPGESKSIAYVLLDKSYEIRSVQALQLLLDAKVNVFESPADVEEAFLVKVFKSNDKDVLPLRKALLDHIVQDESAMDIIKNNLSDYPELISLYKELIDHLDNYACTLKQREANDFIIAVRKILKLGLVLIWKKDTIEKRGEEFAAIKIHLDQSIQVITNNGNETPGRNEFKTARACFEKIIEISEKAKDGNFKRSHLHKEVLRLSKALIRTLDSEKDKIFDKNTADLARLKQEQMQLKEKHEQEIARMQAEAEARQAEAKAREDEAKAREDEAKAREDEAKAREDEAKAREDEAKEEIKKLRELLMANRVLPQHQAAASDNETAAATGHSFFLAGR